MEIRVCFLLRRGGHFKPFTDWKNLFLLPRICTINHSKWKNLLRIRTVNVRQNFYRYPEFSAAWPQWPWRDHTLDLQKLAIFSAPVSNALLVWSLFYKILNIWALLQSSLTITADFCNATVIQIFVVIGYLISEHVKVQTKCFLSAQRVKGPCLLLLILQALIFQYLGIPQVGQYCQCSVSKAAETFLHMYLHCIFKDVLDVFLFPSVSHYRSFPCTNMQISY